MGFKAKCRGIMTYFFSSLSRREPVGASRSRNRLEKRGKVICETERMRLAELDFGLSDSSRAVSRTTPRFRCSVVICSAIHQANRYRVIS